MLPRSWRTAIPTESSCQSPALFPQAELSLQIEVKKVAMTIAKGSGQCSFAHTQGLPLVKLEWSFSRDILGIEGHLSIFRCDMPENIGLLRTCTAPAAQLGLKHCLVDMIAEGWGADVLIYSTTRLCPQCSLQVSGHFGSSLLWLPWKICNRFSSGLLLPESPGKRPSSYGQCSLIQHLLFLAGNGQSRFIRSTWGASHSRGSFVSSRVGLEPWLTVHCYCSQ